MLQLAAGNPMLSSESAPTSPTEKASKFIPPSLAESLPQFDVIPSNIVASNMPLSDGKYVTSLHPFHNHTPFHNSPMQTCERALPVTQTMNPATQHAHAHKTNPTTQPAPPTGSARANPLISGISASGHTNPPLSSLDPPNNINPTQLALPNQPINLDETH